MWPITYTNYFATANPNVFGTYFRNPMSPSSFSKMNNNYFIMLWLSS